VDTKIGGNYSGQEKSGLRACRELEESATGHFQHVSFPFYPKISLLLVSS
jgi:hypothetical protein